MIEGYSSTDLIFKQEIPVGCLTQNQLIEMLKCLTAHAGLTPTEIVGAYAKRKTKISNDLLSVRKDGLHPQFTCGDNTHFIARVKSDE